MPEPLAANVFFIVPAYNEEHLVGSVVRQIKGKFQNVVVVDDGSNDRTGEQAAQEGAQVITHLINRGQGAALKTGIDYALAHKADVIVTFDSDGQHQLEDVDAMLAPVIENRCDVALGSRFLRRLGSSETRPSVPGSKVPLLRKLTLKLGVWFTRLASGIKVTDTHNGLRVLSSNAAARIRIRQDRMAHASEILDEIARLKLRFVEVPTTIVYSNYSRAKGQRSSAAFRIVVDFLIGKSGG